MYMCWCIQTSALCGLVSFVKKSSFFVMFFSFTFEKKKRKLAVCCSDQTLLTDRCMLCNLVVLGQCNTTEYEGLGGGRCVLALRLYNLGNNSEFVCVCLCV